MTDRLPNLYAAIAVLALSVTLMWFGWPGWGVLVLYLGYLGVSLYSRYRVRSAGLATMKTARAGEDFDTFFDRLNRPDYDRKLVMQVYTAVRSMSGLDVEDIALRPYDDLVRDLKIDPDDLGEALWNGMKGPLRLVDTPESRAANPHRFRMQTVGGLIDFFASQPKLGDQTSPETGEAPSTPSARNT